MSLLVQYVLRLIIEYSPAAPSAAARFPCYWQATFACSIQASAASQGACLTHKVSMSVPGLQIDNVQYPQLPDSFDVDDPDQAGVAHPGEWLHGTANAWAAMWFTCSGAERLHGVLKPAQELGSRTCG